MSIPAKFPGTCCACGEPINVDDLIEQAANRLPVQHNGWVHDTCPDPAPKVRKGEIHCPDCFLLHRIGECDL